MTLIHTAVHLQRRFFRALSTAPPSAADDAWAVHHLLPGEAALWWQMQPQDRRHSLDVARRLQRELPCADRTVMAAALMHDVGKIVSRLGTVSRVVATLVGPRTRRLRSYHDHERIGADLLSVAGADPHTITLVRGSSSDAVATGALRRADDI